MKVFRDPVHNLINVNKIKDAPILALINSRELQRLRRIRQLGLSFVTYPGAEHSRFVHSLGVTHLVKRIITQLNYSRNEQEQEWLRNINDNYNLVLCAALLHDIGHGPFSHAIEKTTGIKHEDWTTLIINSDMTLNRNLLKGFEITTTDLTDLFNRVHILKQRAMVIMGESYDSLVVFDDPSTNQYKDSYLFLSGNKGKNDEEASEIIFLFDKDKKPHDLAAESRIINVIRNQSLLLQRLYFPEELRESAIEIFR